MSGEETESDGAVDKSVNKCGQRLFVLSKDSLLQAVETALQPEDKLVGNKAKIKATYTNMCDFKKVICFCSDRSHLDYYYNHGMLSFKRDTSLNPILNEMRLCLLACDWDGYKELLLILFRSPNVANDFILFSIRSCFVLLFNHPKRTPELLDNFMAGCLKINEQSRKIDYLKRCFSLKEGSSSTLNKNISNEGSEEEEEEMVFNCEFSSDKDD